MPSLIGPASEIKAEGKPPKTILEYVGRVNSKTEAVSIAHMKSPAGWSEPGQTPDFDEYSVVLKGSLRLKSRAGVMDVRAGQAVLVRKGEWVEYSTPFPTGAEYISVCIPAFSPDSAHRDAPKDSAPPKSPSGT